MLSEDKDLNDYLLHNVTSVQIYSVCHEGTTPQGLDEETDAWLAWDPSHEVVSSDKPPVEVQIGKSLASDNFSWNAFQKSPGYPETFRPFRFFIETDKRKEKLDSAENELRTAFDIQGTSSLPAIQRLTAVRDEARRKLGKHAERMKKEVMKPLRDVFIACALEAYRNIAGICSTSELSSDEAEKWSNTVKKLEALYCLGVGGGTSFEMMHQANRQTSEPFRHVPDPVSRAGWAAIRYYTEQREGVSTRSRNTILTRALPVFFKWQAARRLISSALYGEREGLMVGDLFKNRPTLRKQAQMIVDKYEESPNSLPSAMEVFKENWIPSTSEADGYSIGSSLVSRVGDAGLGDEYSNPDTFCYLLGQLLEKHGAGSNS